MWGQIAAAVVGSLFSYKAAEQQRRQAIKDQDNQFVRMRNAAQRAGFNPLTVLRNTGGRGFTGLPTISKAAAFGNAAAGIFNAYRQEPIDKYNKQVRDLTLESMKAEIANIKANTRYTGILSKQSTSSTQLPIIPDEVGVKVLGYSDQQINTLVNGALARAEDGDVVDNKLRGLDEPIVMPSGKVDYYSKGMELDEYLTGVAMRGYDDLRTESKLFYQQLIKPVLSGTFNFGPLRERAEKLKKQRKQRFYKFWNE
jgi:hypothetical protein